jgi:hypothetical protein
VTPAAERQRKYRQRRRAGLVVIRVVIDDVSVPQALIAAGLLDEAKAEDADAIGRALERAVVRIERA